MDGVMLYKVKKEIEDTLAGQYVTKIFQPAARVFNFEFRGLKGNHNLFIFLEPNLQAFFLSKKNMSNPPSPPSLTMLLRKHLQGQILKGIEQPGLERLITLDFGRYTIKVELMGRHANLAIVREKIVLGVLRPQGEGHLRPIGPGREYISPPAQTKEDPRKIELDSLCKKPITKEVWRLFFDHLEGVGPQTAKEMARRAGVKPETVGYRLSSEQIKTAVGWLVSLLNQCGAEPTLVQNDNKTNPLPFRPTAGVNMVSYPDLSSLLEVYAFNSWQHQQLEKQRSSLQGYVQKEITKKQKKHQNLSSDYREAQNFEELRIKGEILTAYAHKVKKGMTSVTLPNFYRENEPVTIKIKPHLGSHANAQNYFKRYHKLKKARNHLKREINKTLQQLEYLQQIQHFLKEATTEPEIQELKEELASAGYTQYLEKQTKSKKIAVSSKPRMYNSPDGLRILVGRNNRQNEELVRRAHTLDTWLHARGIPGSHVIVKTDGEDCPPDTLAFAAHLAAFYSSGRQAAKVPVDYTTIKNIKKPRGAPPGYVRYENYKTIIGLPPQVQPESF